MGQLREGMIWVFPRALPMLPHRCHLVYLYLKPTVHLNNDSVLPFSYQWHWFWGCTTQCVQHPQCTRPCGLQTQSLTQACRQIAGRTWVGYFEPQYPCLQSGHRNLNFIGFNGSKCGVSSLPRLQGLVNSLSSLLCWNLWVWPMFPLKFLSSVLVPEA